MLLEFLFASPRGLRLILSQQARLLSCGWPGTRTCGSGFLRLSAPASTGGRLLPACSLSAFLNESAVPENPELCASERGNQAPGDFRQARRVPGCNDTAATGRNRQPPSDHS